MLPNVPYANARVLVPVDHRVVREARAPDPAAAEHAAERTHRTRFGSRRRSWSRRLHGAPGEPAPLATSACGACVREEALAGEPGVEVDDAVEPSASVIGDDEHVLVERRPPAHLPPRPGSGRRRRRGSRMPALVPFGPAEVVNVVRGHEHDEQEVGVEPLPSQRAISTFWAHARSDEVEIHVFRSASSGKEWSRSSGPKRRRSSSASSLG